MLGIRNLKRGAPSRDAGILVSVDDLDLADGQCISITGASGSGKSLLPRAIADLDPCDGAVQLDGRPRHDMAAPHFEDKSSVHQLCERLGLDDETMSWPVRQHSTGERQRLSLVRALGLGYLDIALASIAIGFAWMD